jgi:hypothetical protein
MPIGYGARQWPLQSNLFRWRVLAATDFQNVVSALKRAADRLKIAGENPIGLIRPIGFYAHFAKVG